MLTRDQRGKVPDASPRRLPQGRRRAHDKLAPRRWIVRTPRP